MMTDIDITKNPHKTNTAWAVAATLSLAPAAVSAQDDGYEYEVESRRGDDSFPESLMDDDDGAQYGLSLNRYADEFVALVVLAILIAVVRHMVPRKERSGCTVFIVVFAIVLYVLYMFVL